MNIVDGVLQYYCIDWFAMSCSVFGMYLIGNQYKRGFIFMVASGILWMVFSYLAASPGCFVSSFMSALMSAQAYMNWGKKRKLEVVMNEARQSYDFMNVKEDIK